MFDSGNYYSFALVLRPHCISENFRALVAYQLLPQCHISTHCLFRSVYTQCAVLHSLDFIFLTEYLVQVLVDFDKRSSPKFIALLYCLLYRWLSSFKAVSLSVAELDTYCGQFTPVSMIKRLPNRHSVPHYRSGGP